MVITELDTINEKYFIESIQSVNALVDLKVAIH